MHKFNHFILPILAALSCDLTALFAETSAAKSQNPRACEIAIVGGGAGGLHTAFRLGPQYGAKVCLFEKEEELGGRIHDLPMNPADPNSPRMGVGARRIMEGQKLLFALAAELGLQLETPELGTDLIQARGMQSFQKDDFVTKYPGMPIKDKPDVDQETWLYDQLRKGPGRQHISEYPELRSYVSAITGTESFDYLHDMTRFRGDFEYPIDAQSYMDYLDEEWDVCCVASYPIGGMSAFIRGMESRARASGVQIFKGEAVQSIDRDKTMLYRLSTSKQIVQAKQLIIAVPPSGLQKITGSVADRLNAEKAVQDLIGVRVVTITQWWPKSWWKEIHNPASTSGLSQVWRAWTTDNCLSFIEIPLNPYAVAQNVTRSVYNDDIRCVAFWEQLAKESKSKLEAEIKRDLTQLFIKNGVSEPQEFEIPDPLRTEVQIWPAAWHYLRAGTHYTNKTIAEWALNPINDPNLAFVGEAYFPQRSGWSDAAYKSSIRLLNTKYGLNLPGL